LTTGRGKAVPSGGVLARRSKKPRAAQPATSTTAPMASPMVSDRVLRFSMATNLNKNAHPH
jgi:hypothetical protein